MNTTKETIDKLNVDININSTINLSSYTCLYKIGDCQRQYFHMSCFDSPKEFFCGVINNLKTLSNEFEIRENGKLSVHLSLESNNRLLTSHFNFHSLEKLVLDTTSFVRQMQETVVTIIRQNYINKVAKVLFYVLCMIVAVAILSISFNQFWIITFVCLYAIILQLLSNLMKNKVIVDFVGIKERNEYYHIDIGFSNSNDCLQFHKRYGFLNNNGIDNLPHNSDFSLSFQIIPDDWPKLIDAVCKFDPVYDNFFLHLSF